MRSARSRLKRAVDLKDPRHLAMGIHECRKCGKKVVEHPICGRCESMRGVKKKDKKLMRQPLRA